MSPVKLKPTQAYLAHKAQLSAERRRSLELIEEGIATDPESPLYRREGPAGTIVDYGEPGSNLLVTFRPLDKQTAELIEFVDLLSEP